MGIEILEDGFGGPEDDYYGFFKLFSDTDSFDVFSDLPDIEIEFPTDRIIR